MHFRSDEQDREDQRLRELYERQRNERMVAHLSSAKELFRRSVLPAVIGSFLFGLFAWAAVGVGTPMERRAMMPLGLTLGILAAGLLAYAFWARSAWRIRRDQLDYIEFGAEGSYYGSRSSPSVRVLGSLGSFVVVLFIFRMLLRGGQAAVEGDSAGASGLVITLVVVLAMWGIGVVLDRISDSLPY